MLAWQDENFKFEKNIKFNRKNLAINATNLADIKFRFHGEVRLVFSKIKIRSD